MANITDQFVTSFSELYYGSTPNFGDAYRAPAGTDIIVVDAAGQETYLTKDEFKEQFPEAVISETFSSWSILPNK